MSQSDAGATPASIDPESQEYLPEPPLGSGVGRPAGLPPAGAPSIWLARSPEDGYFAAVLIAPGGDEAAARARAWELFTDGRRDRIDPGTGRPQWELYHTDPSGLDLRELGAEWVGADGEGNLEVEV